MRKVLAIAAFAALIGLPAFGDSITVTGGYFLPSGGSDVFEQNEIETTFEASDLNDFGGTIRYDHFLGEYINLGGGISFYQGDDTVQDRDFVFDDGGPILRDIRLEIVPVEANIHFLPAGRNAAVIPYFGGGFGFYYWEYEEIGDFVINRFTRPEVITGVATSDGFDPGFHVEGGVYIPVSRAAAITIEYKYWNADGDLDEIGFDPSFEPIDLSGSLISGGVSIWF